MHGKKTTHKGTDTSIKQPSYRENERRGIGQRNGTDRHIIDSRRGKRKIEERHATWIKRGKREAKKRDRRGYHTSGLCQKNAKQVTPKFLHAIVHHDLKTKGKKWKVTRKETTSRWTQAHSPLPFSCLISFPPLLPLCLPIFILSAFDHWPLRPCNPSAKMTRRPLRHLSLSPFPMMNSWYSAFGSGTGKWRRKKRISMMLDDKRQRKIVKEGRTRGGGGKEHQQQGGEKEMVCHHLTR